MLLACVVVFVTTYSLILPALTLEVEVAEELPGIYLADEGAEGENASANVETDAPADENVSANEGTEASADEVNADSANDSADPAGDLAGVAQSEMQAMSGSVSETADADITAGAETAAEAEAGTVELAGTDLAETFVAGEDTVTMEVSADDPITETDRSDENDQASFAVSDEVADMASDEQVQADPLKEEDSDVLPAFDETSMVNTLAAIGSGVDLHFTYSNPVSSDTEVLFQEIDRDDPEQSFDDVYQDMTDQISRVYPDWSVFAANFWQIISAADIGVEAAMTFVPAFYDHDGQITFGEDSTGQYVFDEEGWFVYQVEGLRQGIEEGKVILADRPASENAWHFYNPEAVQIETFGDGYVTFTFTTDALKEGAAELGVIVLEENPEEEVTEVESETETETEPAETERWVSVGGDYTIEIPGQDYVLHVSYGEEAGIPADPEIVAVPVEDEEYAAQALEEVKNVVEEETASDESTATTQSIDGQGDSASDQLKLVGLFDLTIYHDGNVIQPQAPVTVSVEFKEGLAENEQIYAVHFPGTGEQPEEETHQTEEALQAGEETMQPERTVQQTESVETETESEQAETPIDTTPEVISTETVDDTAVFTTESLSYIAIVSYTVDFHWNVDGKEYSFSIPGGGYTMLSDVVRILEIVKQTSLGLEIEEEAEPSAEDVRRFVEDVETVEFTSPELLSVSKVDEDTTIGAIKERLSLECEYSAELSEKEIEEINDSEVKATDWALISLKAFTSEESLVITMKDGDIWTIRVTDAQEYLITYNVNDSRAGMIHVDSHTELDDYSVTSVVDNTKLSYHRVRPRSIANANKPAQDGYHFVQWVLHGVNYYSDSTGNIRPNGVEHAQTYTACFAPDNQYLILYTWDNDGGTVSSGTAKSFSYIYPVSPYNTTGQQYYSYSGDGSGLVAVPDESHVFKGWFDEYNNFVSYDPVCEVGKVSRDCILHPVFETGYQYKIITNQDSKSNDLGIFKSGNSKGNYDLSNPYIVTTYKETSGYRLRLYIGAFPNEPDQYQFAYWLKDDGSEPDHQTTTYPSDIGLRAVWLRGDKTYLSRDTTFIAWFAPSNSYIVRLNWPSQGGSAGHLAGQMDPRTVQTDYQNFWYYYSSDGVTLIATPSDGYVFLGWYDNYNSKTGTGTLVSTDDNFYVGNVTRPLNLTPVFEGDVNHRDYYNVWFDGTNGITASAVSGKDIAHGANTLFARKNSSGNVNGAQSVHREVSKQSNSTATITLPTASETEPPMGAAQYNHFTLYGWYMLPEPGSSGAEGKYYSPGDKVTISRDTVFYADWFADSYDIGKDENVFTAKNGIVYPDTSLFIRTDMYDFNTLFNMPSLTLDTDSNISRIGNYEYWKRNAEGTRDFLFISAVSDEMRTLSPRLRKIDWRNQSHEISREGDIYAGIAYQGILETQGLQEDLFGYRDSLGKKYVGRGDNLYLYDTNTGYYYYDSDKNAAAFNQSAHRFYVYDYTNATNKSYDHGGNDKTDFLPFNYGVKEGGFLEEYGEPNYWFGMKSEIDFFLPNATGYQDAYGKYGNQSTHGDEMVFKFCGDDDVWIFVDDQLYLDLGGVHGKVYGEINFSRGTTTIAQFGAGKTDVNNIMSYSEASVGQTGDDSSVGGPENYGDHRLIIPGTINLSEGDHKVTIYYLERGSSQSNCAIYFNLAPRYRLKLHKVDNSSSESLAGATFGIFSDAACTLAANVWETATRTKTNVFTTDSKGYIDVSGLIAGHDYYLKELSAPSGYPDISEEVIKLSLGSLGSAAVSSTADVTASGSTPAWTMAEVTSSETDGSASKGTFVLDLTVKNRKEVSITARKIWAMIDGSNYTRDENSEVTVKLQRYTLGTGSASNTQSYNVRLITRCFTDSDKPINRDTGSISVLGISTNKVTRGGSISFDVTAAGEAAIHSVVSQYGSVSGSWSNYTTSDLFLVNGGWSVLPHKGSFTLSDIRRDTDIYITFIGNADTTAALSTNISEPTIADSDGTSYAKVEDRTFNESDYVNENAQVKQPLEVTLSKVNNWQTTWTGLVGSADSVQYYYYVKEISTTSPLAEKPLLSTVPAYVQTYSSDGLTGGTISVRNTLNAIKVKLRKRDSISKKNVSGAEFKIYTKEEYEAAGFTSEMPSVIETNASIWLEQGKDGSITYDTEKKAFISDNDGRFYMGYLPLGTYYLIETGAPAGYKMLSGYVKVEITEGGLRYQQQGENTWHSKKIDAEGYYNLYIDNTPLTDLRIAKQDTSGAGLSGAVFQLTVLLNGAETLVLSSNDPDYSRIEGLGDVTITASDGKKATYHSAFRSSDTETTLRHLPDGTYRLKEVVTPAGYINTIGTVEFQIVNRVVSLVSPRDSEKVVFTAAVSEGGTSAAALLTIQNEPGISLPMTGGFGTGWFYLLGGLLAAFAGVGLGIKRMKDLRIFRNQSGF